MAEKVAIVKTFFSAWWEGSFLIFKFVQQSNKPFTQLHLAANNFSWQYSHKCCFRGWLRMLPRPARLYYMCNVVSLTHFHPFSFDNCLPLLSHTKLACWRSDWFPIRNKNWTERSRFFWREKLNEQKNRKVCRSWRNGTILFELLTTDMKQRGGTWKMICLFFGRKSKIGFEDDWWRFMTLQLLIVKSTKKKSVETLYFVQLKNYYYCDGDQHLLNDVSFCADYGFPKNLLII